MLKKIIPLILSIFILMVNINPSLAEPILKGKYGDWNVFINPDTDSQMCFIASKPIKQIPSSKSWDPTFYITTFGEASNEPSVSAGYNYKNETQASIKILEYTFLLSTNGQGAWLGTVKEEEKLIDAMKKGASMVVKGESEFNTLTTDTYSLKGVTRSILEMNKLCPIK
jgi:hypothetical protein